MRIRTLSNVTTLLDRLDVLSSAVLIPTKTPSKRLLRMVPLRPSSFSIASSRILVIQTFSMVKLSDPRTRMPSQAWVIVQSWMTAPCVPRTKIAAELT